MLVAFVVVWYLVGIFSFVYWWTKDYDFTNSKVPIALFVGLIGPVALLLGLAIHGNPTVIVKRRDSND